MPKRHMKGIPSINTALYEELQKHNELLNNKYIQLQAEISQLKSTLEFLRGTNQNFENIVDSALDAIIISDNKGFISKANRSFAKLVGRLQDEIMGIHISQFSPSSAGMYESTTGELIKIGDEFFTELNKHITGIVANGNSSNVKSYLIDKSKIIIPVEENIIKLYDTKGNAVGAVGIIRDVTHRIKAEQEVIKTRDYLKNIFNTSLDGIVVSDADGFIRMANNSMERISGYSMDELLGKHTKELSPQGKDYGDGPVHMIKQLYEKGFISNFQYLWLRKNGELIDVELNIALLRNDEGTVVGSVGTTRDITAKKKLENALRNAEERHSNLIKYANDAIISADEKGSIVEFNLKAEQIFGYSRDEVIGKNALMLIPSALKDPHSKGIEMFQKSHIVTANNQVLEGKGLRKDSREIIIEYSPSCVENDGKYFLTNIVRDVTARKQLEEKLIKSRVELKRFARKLLSVREEERKKLSATLHDEVGSMAVALGSLLQMSKNNVKQNNEKMALNNIEKAQAMLSETAHNLRQIAYDLRPPIINLADLPGLLKEYFSSVTQATNLEIDLNICLDNITLSEKIVVVLYRSIQELMNNVVKHAKAKKVKVRLYYDKPDSVLIFTDDGEGFDAGILSTNTSGLGIQGIKENIDALQGKFIIKSGLQEGTEVYIYIPIDGMNDHEHKSTDSR